MYGMFKLNKTQIKIYIKNSFSFYFYVHVETTVCYMNV